MTLHRWRKARDASDGVQSAEARSKEANDQSRRISDLRLENSRLRALVADLLLQKIDLEETIRGEGLPPNRTRRLVR